MVVQTRERKHKMSSKNQLQEYFQQLGVAVPKYESFQFSRGGFGARVLLPDGRTFECKEQSARKKEAELKVAEMAFKHIQENADQERKERHEALMASYESRIGGESTSNHYLLIDLENISDMSQDDWGRIPETCTVYVFYTDGFNAKDKFPPWVTPMVVKGYTADLADHYLTFMADVWSTSKNVRFSILSKDHCAECTATCLRAAGKTSDAHRTLDSFLNSI